jgi:hypothetical protein
MSIQRNSVTPSKKLWYFEGSCMRPGLTQGCVHNLCFVRRLQIGTTVTEKSVMLMAKLVS